MDLSHHAILLLPLSQIVFKCISKVDVNQLYTKRIEFSKIDMASKIQLLIVAHILKGASTFSLDTTNIKIYTSTYIFDTIHKCYQVW